MRIEGLRDLHRRQRVDLQDLSPYVPLHIEEILVGRAAADAGVVQQHVDWRLRELLRQLVDALEIRDVQLLYRDVRVLCGQRVESLGLVRFARGRNHVPAPLCVMLCEFKPDAAIRTGDEHGRHVVVAETGGVRGLRVFLEQRGTAVCRGERSAGQRDRQKSGGDPDGACANESPGYFHSRKLLGKS